MKVVTAVLGKWKFINVVNRVMTHHVPDYDTFAVPGGKTVTRERLQRIAKRNKQKLDFVEM